MGQLIYSMISSLDGYISDESGTFGWGGPDDELHDFVNGLFRPVGTYLYGRRMYETMVFWETAHTLPDRSDSVKEYARVWQAAEKVVYSTTLEEVASARTRIERTFDPEQVSELKAAADHDLTIDGPGLAAHALRAGLVDVVHLLIAPVVVGGGKRLYDDGIRLDLDLVDQRSFGSGFVHLHYRVRA